MKNYCGDKNVILPASISLQDVILGDGEDEWYGTPYMVCYWTVSNIPDNSILNVNYTKNVILT